MDGARRIRGEKLREDRHREGYARSLEVKRVRDGENVEHTWEQVKWTMVESVREVCGSVLIREHCSKH